MVLVHAVSRFPVHAVRLLVLRAFGAQIAEDVVVYHGFEVRRARNLSVGARSKIGNDAVLDARGGITLGVDVNLSSGVNIWTGQHDWQAEDFGYVSAPVFVGDHAWLSTRVTILPGVTIGEGAVVAAGAVVAQDVEPYTLVGGVPAKVIGKRPTGLSYQLDPRRRKAWWW